MLVWVIAFSAGGCARVRPWQRGELASPAMQFQMSPLKQAQLDSVLEITGSYKTGKYVPGTLIPVVDEAKLATDAPEYLLLFSWHIADELMPKLKKSGFKGDFIVPLPKPRIVPSASV